MVHCRVAWEPAKKRDQSVSLHTGRRKARMKGTAGQDGRLWRSDILGGNGTQRDGSRFDAFSDALRLQSESFSVCLPSRASNPSTPLLTQRTVSSVVISDTFRHRMRFESHYVYRNWHSLTGHDRSVSWWGLSQFCIGYTVSSAGIRILSWDSWICRWDCEYPVSNTDVRMRDELREYQFFQHKMFGNRDILILEEFYPCTLMAYSVSGYNIVLCFIPCLSFCWLWFSASSSSFQFLWVVQHRTPNIFIGYLATRVRTRSGCWKPLPTNLRLSLLSATYQQHMISTCVRLID